MSVNLSSTTPAAPAGSTNVVFATDGSGSISGSVSASSALLTAASVDLTAQTANVSATNLVTSPTGVYRVSAYIIVTTADGASSTLPSVVLSWTDQDNAQAQTLTLTPTNSGNALTTYQESVALLSVSNAAAIQYSTSGYASGTPAAMHYAVHIRVEKM